MTLPMPSAAALNALPYTEALEQALGQVIANARRDCEARLATADALLAAAQARLAETEARCAALLAETTRKVDEKLATLRDGADCDMPAVMARVDELVAAIPAPQDGKDVDPAVVESLRAEIAEVRGEILPPVDLSEIEGRIAAVEAREIPDMSGFATKDQVTEGLLPLIDARGADTEAIARIERALDEARAKFATKEDIADVKAAIPEPVALPDVSGFATKGEVAEAIAALPPVPQMPELPDIPALVREAVAVIEPPDVTPVIAEKVAEAVAAIPPAEPGKDADMDAILRHVEVTVAAAIPPREELRGPPGVLPIVREWADGVHYAGEAVTHNGATWQALRDTGREPPHDDWICIASRGAAGEGFSVCSTWGEGEAYCRNDVVMKDGSSWVALRDDPGACPGDGWQLWASRGGKGKPGDVPSVEEIAAALVAQHGEHLRGLPGATIAALYVNEEGVLTVTMADGSEHTADFYPVLSRIAK